MARCEGQSRSQNEGIICLISGSSSSLYQMSIEGGVQMTLEQVLNILACVALILFGAYALVRPYETAQFAHLKPEDNNGEAEIRINFGGLFILLGVAPLVINEPAGYQVVGIALLGAFVTRLITLVTDRPQTTIPFILSAVFELLVGLALFVR